MQVTNVRVSFLREKQPAQYEKSAPAVEFAAVLDEGESAELVARELMTSATAVVYNGLGYNVPPRVAQALANGKVPSELAVEKELASVDELEFPVVSTYSSVAAAEAAEDTTKKKKGGRPVGSKNTGPKKETAKVKRLREEAEVAATEAAAELLAGDDAVPGDEPTDTPKDQISTGEERVDPDTVPGDDETPGDAEAESGQHDVAGEEFTPKDLHTLIMSHVNATPRTLSVGDAKQVLAHFKVARAQDLTNEQALEGKSMVEKMVAAR